MHVHVSFQRIFPDGTILASLSIAQEVSFATMYLLMATAVLLRIESFSAVLIIARVLPIVCLFMPSANCNTLAFGTC